MILATSIMSVGLFSLYLAMLRTGVRGEGMYFRTNALITKPAISVGAVIVLEILKITGFKLKATTQPLEALMGIKMLVSAIPATFLLISLKFLFLYPLHGEYLKKIKDEVSKLHEEKKKKLLSI